MEPNTTSTPTDRYSTVPAQVYQLCQELAQVSMKEAFDKTPYDWQKSLCAHLLLMTCPASTFPPGPVFLCASTGSGKSLSRDAFAASQGLVSWCITPLLSLGANQEKNVNAHSQRGDGSVVALHIDGCRRPSDQRRLCDKIKQLRRDSMSTVVILSSPQALTNNQIYLDLFCYLVEQSMLTLLTVDEPQLFVQFGARFRPEFYALKEKVFRLVIVDGTEGTQTKFPVLFMTATGTKAILEQLEGMTGLFFDKGRNLFWPPADEIVQRNCYIRVVLTNRPMLKLQALISELLRKNAADSLQRKWLVFANSRTKVEDLAARTKDFLDTNELPGDVVTIVGTQTKEQKLFYTNLLLSPRPMGSDFDPLGGYLTRSVGSAGLDSPDVHLVFSPDWPTSVATLWQERGCAGRRPRSNCTSDQYCFCMSLESLVNLIRRIWLPEDNDVSSSDGYLTREEYRSSFIRDLMELVRIVVLGQECLIAACARCLGNPYMPPTDPLPCPRDCPACSYCDGSLSRMFPSLLRHGVAQAVMEVFHGPTAVTDPVLDGSFIAAFRKKRYNKLIFGLSDQKVPEPGKIEAMVLMLLAADIIDHRVKFAQDDKKKERPIILATLPMAKDLSGLALHSDDHWKNVSTKPT